MTQTLSLDLGERSYDIHIGKGLLDQIDTLLPYEKEDLQSRSVFILYDENVYPYAQVMEGALERAGVQSKIFSMKGGEPTNK